MKPVFYIKSIIVLTLIQISFGSCSKSDVPETAGGLINEKCFEFNSESHTGEDFLIFHKGSQQYGMAKGIKINRDWEASMFLGRGTGEHEAYYGIVLATYYIDEIFNDTLLSERIDILNISRDLLGAKTCVDLFDRDQVSGYGDSLATSYRLFHGDAPFQTKYTLDEDSDNKIEIVNYDESEELFDLNFKATFISENPIEPEFPGKVRFYDVVISNKS